MSRSTDVTLPPAPWRRPTLIAAGASLLAVGAWVNTDRLGLDDDVPDDLEVAGIESEHRLVAFEHADESGGNGQRHRGEEGKMGRPAPKNKSGLYAMQGPKDAVPQMARNFDPDMAARNAGILGMIEEDSGHFLASPSGGGFAVGNDEEDVWGGLDGTEIGEALGVQGLGMVGTGRGGAEMGERYAPPVPLNPFVASTDDAKSTFSIDVDTASYANTRRFLLRSGQLPPPEAVRTEELVNYFDYDYALPDGDVPFSVTTEVGPAPWNASHRLVHVGLQGKVLGDGSVPPRNLVFLVDVSGSMASDDKLPLVKQGLAALTEQLDSSDWLSIVVYAGAAGAVLPPTRGDRKEKILAALERLESGGSTNGAAGIHLAYRLAEKHFIRGGVNRVILASDGDFNVGTSSTEALVELIEAKRTSGVFLSVLGVGTGNFNDHMMEQLADKGNGNYAYIDGPLEARKVLVQEAGAMLDTIAKDVKIQVEFDPTQVKSHRLVGYENRKLAHRDFDDDTKDAGEIGAGHTVTALYEIVPTKNASADELLMALDLRYKQPDADASAKVSFAVHDDGHALAQTSDDYRFSAAVATFAQKLRGAEDESESTWSDILELAAGATGDDPHCYRREFLDLVWRAGTLSGETIAVPPTGHCSPTAPPPRRVVPPPAPEVESDADVEIDEASVETTPTPAMSTEQDWTSFALEVLRLLPPLLALPLFVLAFRRPRRRDEHEALETET